MPINKEMLAGVLILEGKNEARISIQPYKLLCIQVRGIRKTFLFIHTFSQSMRQIRRRGSAVRSLRHRISFLSIKVCKRGK